MQNTNDSVEAKSIKKCPHCRKEVDLKATKCPHCQSDMRIWIRRHPIVFLFLFAAFVPMFVNLIISGPTPQATSAQKLDEIKLQSARILAKSYIEKVPLKSPSTAKYNHPTTEVDPKNPNLYEVSSYIDSQNGFGAMIRTYWSMKLEFIGEDNQGSIETDANWKIKEFIFDGDKIK